MYYYPIQGAKLLRIFHSGKDIPFYFSNFAAVKSYTTITMKKASMLLLCLAVLTLDAGAQTSKNTKKPLEALDTMLLVNAYIDTLVVTRERLDSIYKLRLDSIEASDGQDVRIDGKYYRLLTPLTFYHSPAGSAISRRGDGSLQQVAIDKALIDVYLSRPDLVRGSETEMQQAGSIRRDLEEEVKPDVTYVDIIEDIAPEVEPEEQADVVITKPNFWSYSCETNFQLLQNYFSDNWYKGGDNTLSSVASATIQANYNNQKGFKFENKLEMKIGFQTSPADTVHKFKTNNDLLRYTGLIGVQATKNWYYSLQLLAYTQFSPGYNTNSSVVKSDFLSPLTVNVGLGMTYQVSALKGKLTGSVSISALSYNMKYVDRLALSTNNGIDEGKHTKHDFGSQVTTNLTWKFNDNVSWKARIYYYTTYEDVLFEWENTLTCSLSKYISATIFLYPRFDDDTTSDDDLGHWQFKEYCSLGLSYSF